MLLTVKREVLVFERATPATRLEGVAATLKEGSCNFKCLQFGLACAPLVFTKILGCPAETVGNADDHLQRQHLDPGRVQGSGLGPCDMRCVLAGESGFRSKPDQVPTGTDASYKVSQLRGQLAQPSLPSGKIKNIRAET